MTILLLVVSKLGDEQLVRLFEKFAEVVIGASSENMPVLYAKMSQIFMLENLGPESGRIIDAGMSLIVKKNSAGMEDFLSRFRTVFVPVEREEKVAAGDADFLK